METEKHTEATDGVAPEVLRDIAKSESLHGHPFVRLALRNAADEIERKRRIIDKLIDAWPNDDIPVEALDGRA